MESNLLLEQYSWYKKQQLAKAPFECLLNADIEPNPHQVNAFCAAIQALKTGGIILADEVGLGKTIEAGLVLNYVLDNGAKKVLISLPATLRKQWEVELLRITQILCTLPTKSILRLRRIRFRIIFSRILRESFALHD